jgi:hypothetical protein
VNCKVHNRFLLFSIASLTVLQLRRLEGCWCRVPSHFYNQVWDIMIRTPEGISVQGHILPQQPTLSNMTQSELTFALLIEEILNHITYPEYRQIIVELLSIVSTILLRNPELSFRKQLDLDELVNNAYHMFCKVRKEYAYHREKCPRARPRKMYGSTAIERQIFEKAQKEFAMLRPLDFSQSRSNLAQGFDKLCRSNISLGPVSRRYGSAVIPDQSSAI